MTILGAILAVFVGLVVGLLVPTFLPKRPSLNFAVTAGLGVGGSIIGVMIVRVITGTAPGQTERLGFFGSFIGALVLVGMYVLMRRSSAART